MKEEYFTDGTEIDNISLAETGVDYKPMMDELNSLSEKIIGKAIEIHKTLGPGLLESSYRECLYYELRQLGLKVEREKSMPLTYKEVRLEQGYRIDLLVENKLVIELKATEGFVESHISQVLTYLKLGKFKLGLLINFNAPILVKGIKRIIN